MCPGNGSLVQSLLHRGQFFVVALDTAGCLRQIDFTAATQDFLPEAMDVLWGSSFLSSPAKMKGSKWQGPSLLGPPTLPG